MTRYLLMPFRAAPLMLVVVLTILWTVFIKFGGLLGIPGDFILLSWFFKYCYSLLDAVIAGHKELPVMSVEMLNPSMNKATDSSNNRIVRVHHQLVGLSLHRPGRRRGSRCRIADGAAGDGGTAGHQ